MEELKKIRRVVERELGEPPAETLLVVDGTTGQNAISQAKLFNAAAELTGIVVTKLDSTAKGGVLVAIVDELEVPMKLVGLGETPDALQPFVAVRVHRSTFRRIAREECRNQCGTLHLRMSPESVTRTISTKERKDDGSTRRTATRPEQCPGPDRAPVRQRLDHARWAIFRNACRSRSFPPDRSRSISRWASAACRADASSKSTAPKSSGKTTLALHAIAEAQKTRRHGGIHRRRARARSQLRAALGVDLENLLVSQPDNGEQALEIAEMLIKLATPSTSS